MGPRTHSMSMTSFINCHAPAMLDYGSGKRKIHAKMNYACDAKFMDIKFYYQSHKSLVMLLI